MSSEQISGFLVVLDDEDCSSPQGDGFALLTVIGIPVICLLKQ